LEAGGLDCAEVKALHNSSIIHALETPVDLPILLRSQLDSGEASVIHTAVVQGISTVAIDEKLGRRMARLHDLRVTGSVGILVKASKLKIIPDITACFDRMHKKGVWMSEALKISAIAAVDMD